MPNYVRNLIRVADGDFQALADFMKSEKRTFDFNKLISMPPTMLYLKKKYNGISRQSELGFKYWSALTKADKYALIAEFKAKGYDLRSTLKEGYDRYLAYKDCGHWNSLEWAVANWGTKRNAFDVDVNPPDRTIFFNTAWSAPIPIYKALAKQFPTAVISVKYYDEGGWFVGYCNIESGKEYGEDYECESDKGKEIINEINGHEQKADAFNKASELADEATKTSRATYEEVRQACIDAIKWQADKDKLELDAKNEDEDVTLTDMAWKTAYDAEVVRHAKVEAELKTELDALKAEHAKAQQQLTEYRQTLAELSKSNSEMVKEITALSLKKIN